MIAAGLTVCLIVSAVVIAKGIKASCASTKDRFRQMGDLTGKTKQEIMAVVGPPTAFSKGIVSPEHMYEVLQWQSSGYHIAIKFMNGKFVAVTHEWSAG